MSQRHPARGWLAVAAIAGLASLLGGATAQAATFPVTNTNDAGADSLRAALLAANSNGQSETDQIPISATGIINLQSALPTIDGPATISGPGPAQLRVRRSIGVYRVFGIVVTGADNTVTIEGLSVADGTLGIDLAGAGQVVVKNVIVRGNVNPGGLGAGVSAFNIVDSPRVKIIDSTIHSNQAGSGAGVVMNGGTLEVINSTITGNAATVDGGGIYVVGQSPVTLASSTIVANRADSDNAGGGDGGGTYNLSGLPFSVANTLYAANQVGTGQLSATTQCGGSSAYLSLGYNLRTVADAGCSGFGATGDTVNPNALIGTLSDNGGPTETIGLLPGSPAIDGGNPAPLGGGFPACEAADQRGVPRGALAGRCDIGAFESQGTPPPSQPTQPITGKKCKKGFKLKTVKKKGKKPKRKCVRKKKRKRGATRPAGSARSRTG